MPGSTYLRAPEAAMRALCSNNASRTQADRGSGRKNSHLPVVERMTQSAVSPRLA